MARKITELVEKGEIKPEAVARLKKRWVENVDELYCNIRMAVEYGNDGNRNSIAEELGIPVSALRSYMDYIKPYVSPAVFNRTSGKPQERPTGCLITDEQMQKIRWINSLTLEQFDEWTRQETERFYREHPEFR